MDICERDGCYLNRKVDSKKDRDGTPYLRQRRHCSAYCRQHVKISEAILHGVRPPGGDTQKDIDTLLEISRVLSDRAYSGETLHVHDRNRLKDLKNAYLKESRV